MASEWDHSELGHLVYDRGRDAWRGSVNIPPFKAFTHTWVDHVPGQCDLILEANDGEDTPSPAAIEITLRLLNGADRFVRALIDSLWDDFNGRGPRSGMWWHGDLTQVAESGEGEDVPPLTDADALLGWMHPNGIIVRNAGAQSEDKPLIELSCSAVFEIEHSVGILTDGQAVLGMGYLYDVEPFKPN